MADSVDGNDLGAPDEVTLAPAPESGGGTRRRMLALWSSIVVLGLVAAAFIVTSGDDDPPKLPVALGSPTGGGARNEAAAADMSMMAYVRYVAGEDLPMLGDDGPAYKLRGDVSEGRVRELADALGIDGDVVRQDQGWLVDDGEGHHLEVYEGGGGSWWYSPEFTDVIGGGTAGGSAGSSGTAEVTEDEIKAREAEAAAVAAGGTEPCDPDPATLCASDVPTPDPITPPEDLPTEDEARELALDLFRSAGLDVDGAKVTVDGPYEEWYVMVEPRLDGRLVSGLGWSASIGSKGKITSAGGSLNAPERLGDYPVLDTHAAIDRLNEQMVPYGGDTLAVEDDIASSDVDECVEKLVDGETVTSCSGSASEGVGVDPACDVPTSTTLVDPATLDTPDTRPADDPDTPVASDPVQIDPMPVCPTEPVPSEPMEIVLHEAEEILVLVGTYDDSGDAYLVPGYRMTGDDGAVVEVPAVDDDSLLPPPPDPVTTVPGDEPGATDPGVARCAELPPGPDGAVPDICLDPNSIPPTEPAQDPAVDLPAEAPTP